MIKSVSIQGPLPATLSERLSGVVQSPERPDPLGLVGTMLGGKYRVDALVGEGSFGLVYRAEHVLWGQPVALKLFAALKDAPVDEREELLRDFVREGALLAELSTKSTSIVQARDVATWTSAAGEWMPYLVLEWLDGVTLEQHLEMLATASAAPVRWTAEAMLSVIAPLGEVLELVHQAGVAHRDVKPANIFLRGGVPEPGANAASPARVKLLDFGVAKAVASHADLRNTSTGASVVTSFTPAYGAPEQFSRKWGATGPATDVFALALVAVELLAGRPPLDGASIMELGVAACDASRRPTPGCCGAAVTPALEDVFRVALAVRPEDRFASTAAFVAALRRALALVTESEARPDSRDAPQVSTSAAPPNPVRRRFLPVAVFAGLLAGLGGLAGWRASTRRSAPAPVTPLPASAPVSVTPLPASAPVSVTPLPASAPVSVTPPPASAVPLKPSPIDGRKGPKVQPTAVKQRSANGAPILE